MSLTFSQPTKNPKPSSKPSKPEEELVEKTPQEKSLLRQKEQIERRLERFKKASLADRIRNVALAFQKIAQPADPNENPIGLFAQVDDTLSDLGLKNIAERNKTRLIIGKTNAKKENMYGILIRRQAEITSDTITRISRNKDNFEAIKWSSRGIEAFVWGPYAPPAEGAPEVPEGTPGI